MKKILNLVFLIFMRIMVFAQDATDLYLNACVAQLNGNHNEAFINFKKAADKGHAGAMYNVAMCYEYGEGTAKDDKKAFSYMSQAASKQWSSAYAGLGRYYLFGIGINKNEHEAFNWWKNGAEQKKDDLCMYNLGCAYANGIGVSQNYEQAVYWYRKSADLGNPMAAQNLGSSYMLGYGVIKNEHEAVKWWRIAAESDAPDCAIAQYCMGMCYLDGTGGTPVNRTIALSWFKKAAAKGHTDSLIKIIEIEGK